MNTRRPPSSPRRSNLTGVLVVFCVAALIAGIGFDFGAGAHPGFWIGDQVGAAAAIGVAGAVFAVVVARVMRLLLGRKEGSGDAGLHS
jgi:hypothetical protein